MLNKEELKRGFRIKNGKLTKFDKTGRERNHWMKEFRNKSKSFLKDKCEDCKTKESLTIHHEKALSKAKTPRELHGYVTDKSNCKTLCRKCHDEEECAIEVANEDE